MDQLCDHERDKDIEAELDKLPADLNETYERILKKIENLKPVLQILAQKSSIWVFYSVRPLCIAELVGATAVDDTCSTSDDLKQNTFSQEAILDACSNLLVVEDAIVRPSHFSVQEYFTKTRVKKNEDIFTSIRDPRFGHTQISICCLNYLMLDMFWEHVDSEENLKNRVAENPLAPYAAFFFDAHILELDEPSHLLVDCLRKFLRYRNKSLKSVFQLRRFQGSSTISHKRKVFLEMDYPIEPEDIILATRLYGSKQLFSVDTKWTNLTPPRFALHRAVEDGAIDTVKSLISHGQSMGELDYYGMTPLYYACDNGFIDITAMLLNSGAETGTICENHGNALYAASVRGNLVIVRKLIEYGASTNIQAGFHGNALCAAVHEGHFAIVEFLLKHNADPRSVNKKDNSALFIAAYKGYDDIVRLLLHKGATLKHRTDMHMSEHWFLPMRKGGINTGLLMIIDHNLLDGQDALRAALSYGHVTIASILADHDPGYFENIHLPGLIDAASSAGYYPLVEFLIQILPSHKNSKAFSSALGLSLGLFLAYGQWPMVKRLCDLGASKDSKLMGLSRRGIHLRERAKPQDGIFYLYKGFLRALLDFKVNRPVEVLTMQKGTKGLLDTRCKTKLSLDSELWYSLTYLDCYKPADYSDAPKNSPWKPTRLSAEVADRCNISHLIDRIEFGLQPFDIEEKTAQYSALLSLRFAVEKLTICLRYLEDHGLLTAKDSFYIIVHGAKTNERLVTVASIGVYLIEDLRSILLESVHFGPSYNEDILANTTYLSTLVNKCLEIFHSIGLDLGLDLGSDLLKRFDVVQDCVYVLSFGLVLYAHSHISNPTKSDGATGDLLELNLQYIKLEQVKLTLMISSKVLFGSFRF